MEKINITISLICIGSPKNLMNLKERKLPILAAMCTFFRSKYAKYFQSIVDARVYISVYGTWYTVRWYAYKIYR